jgi:hypothetical protein
LASEQKSLARILRSAERALRWRDVDLAVRMADGRVGLAADAHPPTGP